MTERTQALRTLVKNSSEAGTRSEEVYTLWEASPQTEALHHLWTEADDSKWPAIMIITEIKDRRAAGETISESELIALAKESSDYTVAMRTAMDEFKTALAA